MSEKDDGGPAFPLSMDAAMAPVKDIWGRNISSGMSLRDWFAGQALAGLSNVGNIDLYDTAYARTANEAYRFADAMLAERRAALEKAGKP